MVVACESHVRDVLCTNKLRNKGKGNQGQTSKAKCDIKYVVESLRRIQEAASSLLLVIVKKSSD